MLAANCIRVRREALERKKDEADGARDGGNHETHNRNVRSSFGNARHAAGGIARRGRDLHYRRPAGSSGLCAAPLPGGRLHLAPGYWAWGDGGYYWVPGAWVAPPAPGLLWTPGYWGFPGGIYAWHAGYWGPHVGYYGGVNYGFGYPGHGFVGGVWAGGVFRYNTAVVNVNRTVVRNVYLDRSVVVNHPVVNRTSFNGPGGLNDRPTRGEQTAIAEHHAPATAVQMDHHTASAPRPTPMTNREPNRRDGHGRQ